MFKNRAQTGTLILQRAARTAIPHSPHKSSGTHPFHDQMARPRPFSVEAPDTDVADMQNRLNLTRLAPPSPYPGWEQGMENDTMRNLLEYWRDHYDWRAAERYLNRFQQYKQQVNGIDMHFVHERAEQEQGAIPIVLLHGWPGSFFEFHKIIGPLTQGTDVEQGIEKTASGLDYAPRRRLCNDGYENCKGQPDSPLLFHTVVPSLPGYGFSSAPTAPGHGVQEIALTINALMLSLGYTRYVAHGGDWGAIICQALARNHTENCVGVHVTMLPAPPQLWNPLHLMQMANAALPLPPLVMSQREQDYVRKLRMFQDKESGYQKEQSTKPQTLAYALTDSPAGLLAWIVEKFHTWADLPDGQLFHRFTRDELLTNVCIYHLSRNIGPSMRLYYEFANSQKDMQRVLSGPRSDTPMAVARFPKEILLAPTAWLRARVNLVQVHDMPRGGHFAALEEPQLLLQDVRTFVHRHIRGKLI